MYRVSVGKALISLTILVSVTTACGADPNQPPPGVAAHLPGARAADTGGTCRLVTTNQLRQVFGGSPGTPTADNLTPGFDRCTWTIRNSNLTASDIEVVVSRTSIPPTVAQTSPPATSKGRRRSAKMATSTSITGLGAGATWTPAQYALAWPSEGGSIGVQIVIRHGTALNAAKTQDDVTALAHLIQAAKIVPRASP